LEHSASAGARGTAAPLLAAAARAVAAVASDGRSAAATALPPAVRAVTLGTLRWYPRLAALVALLAGGRALSPQLSALLAVALYQLEYSQHPAQITVSCSVDAARLLHQPHAARLVNALLRRFGRERAALLAAVLGDPVAASAHPAWLLSALQQAWPADWEQIVAANNAQAPLTLRVDLSRCSLEDYCAQLAAHGLSAAPLAWSPTALVLSRPVAVSRLPGFADGLVSVQDAGAQLACRLLGVRRGEQVLDACAAPGGKTGALLEAAAGEVAVTAVDVDAGRLALVGQNLQRLQRQARLVAADLTEPPQWWDGQPFDRILVDAPCSAVGVIRRHPDIKLLRRPQDIEALAQLQVRVLACCLTLLKPGGVLLYCTCSVLPAENDAVIEHTLAAIPAARSLPLPAAMLPPQARPCRHGVQLLPGSAALTDGFYYACLTVAER
jgi:16S rRNA (cytosine967-C5)-methyltransferase